LEGKKAEETTPRKSTSRTLKRVDQQYLMSQGSPPQIKIAGLFLGEYPPDI
jgi:hypothetical protein